MIDELNLQHKIRQLLGCPDLEIALREEWASTEPNHRNHLHQEIELRNPKKEFNSSISHCTLMGGIALSRFPIGLDIEVRHRVEWPIVQRVSTLEEVALATEPSALWCAKEAAFKALKKYSQPSVISEISIGGWQKIDSQTEKYQLLNSAHFHSPAANKGLIIHDGDLTISFFIFCP